MTRLPIRKIRLKVGALLIALGVFVHPDPLGRVLDRVTAANEALNVGSDGRD